MSRHYKKLIFLLIPACAGFCLALTLGSAEQTSELCHLCQNKALVKEAILAFDEDPYDSNLPEPCDPNYVQYGPGRYVYIGPRLHLFVPTNQASHLTGPYRIESIIAEGDMVSVRLSCSATIYYYEDEGFDYVLMASYRISNGKIVEGWVAQVLAPIHFVDLRN